MGVSEILLITGMSGAGRSTAAHVLEDLGWYVVDNLPPALLPALTNLQQPTPAAPKIAVVIDVRGRAFFTELQSALKNLPEKLQILFLDANDEALVKRFESTRRPHPLQNEDRVLDGINRERSILAELRSSANLIIDTSSLNVHQLKERIESSVGKSDIPELHMTILSFGFKYGVPLDVDFVIDVRFIANPYWVPELRELNGLDARVSSNVFQEPIVEEFIQGYSELLQKILPAYQKEGKRYLTIGVGCTGGKHRSVAVSRRLAELLMLSNYDAKPSHRDIGRE